MDAGQPPESVGVTCMKVYFADDPWRLVVCSVSGVALHQVCHEPSDVPKRRKIIANVIDLHITSC
jgi:hypothetical protein